MKKLNFLLLAVTIIAFSSCSNLVKKAKDAAESASSLGKAYDKDLTKQETYDKSFADLKTKLNGATKVNQIMFLVSDEYGTSMEADVQSTTNPKAIVRYSTGFQGTTLNGPAEVEISYSGNEEEFKIDDFLFDLNAIAIDKLGALVKDAIAKTAEKCDEVIAYQLRIELNNRTNIPEINIFVKGKLKSNGIKKTYIYKTELSGKFIEIN